MQYQQRLLDRKISLVVLQARTTNYDHLLPLVPDVLAALENLSPSSVVKIGIG